MNSDKKILVIAVVFFAVISSAVCAYPDLKFAYELKGKYKGINLLNFSDEVFYLARLSAVYKGDNKLSNPGIFEHRNDPPVISSLFEVAFISILRIFNVGISGIKLIYVLTVPAVIFILLYLLSYRMFKNGWYSIVFSLFFLLGFWLLSRYALSRGGFIFKNPLFFSRTVSPGIYYIPFLTTLILIKLSFEHKKSLILTYLSGAFSGLLFYTNLYFWSFIYSGLFFLFIFSFFSKDSFKKNILIILITASVLSIPYWLSLYSLTKFPSYKDFLIKFSMEYSRRPILPVMHLIILLCFLICIMKFKEYHKEMLFILAFALGGLLCINQQIITGRLMQSGHWETYTNKLFNLYMLFFMIVFVIKYSKFFKKAQTHYNNIFRFFVILVILIPLVHAFLVQNSFYSLNKDIWARRQALKEPYDWLRKNTAQDSVILTPIEERIIPDLVVVYANRYTYASETFFISGSLVPIREARERVLYAANFFGFDSDKLGKNYFSREGFMFTCTSNRLFREAYMKEQKADVLRQYESSLKGDPISDLKKYRIDYVLLETSYRPFMDSKYGRDSRVKKHYDDGNYMIFKIL